MTSVRASCYSPLLPKTDRVLERQVGGTANTAAPPCSFHHPAAHAAARSRASIGLVV